MESDKNSKQILTRTKSVQSKKSKREKMKEQEKEMKRKKSIYIIEKEKMSIPQENNLEELTIRSLGKVEDLRLEPDTPNLSTCSAQLARPIIIGITGGSGSGKSLLAKLIKQNIKTLGIQCVRIKEKNFLKDIGIEDPEKRRHFLLNYDFDSNSAIDWGLFNKCLSHLETRRPFNTPIYDLFSQQRILRTRKTLPADLIIVEGRLFFNDENLRRKCDVKIFMNTDSDIMLSRRVFHNVARSRDLKAIISRYNRFVKPAYEKLIEPMKAHADLVVPNFGGTNFNLQEIEHDAQILKILVDLLKYRLKDTNAQAKRILDNMSNFADIRIN